MFTSLNGIDSKKIFGEVLSFLLVYFCYLKCGTGVFGEQNNCCVCACSRIAVSSVVFARESDSLIN